jgi:ABC-type glycerol-3-phosphate transport system substrate-binding protein
MKKFALGLAGAAAASTLALAPSANAAAPQAATPNTARITCWIPAPGQFVEVTVPIVAIENTNSAHGVPMPWNCLQ